MKTTRMNMLDHASIKQAFVKAIQFVGEEQFKKTSMFGSNDVSAAQKTESLAA